MSDSIINENQSEPQPQPQPEDQSQKPIEVTNSSELYELLLLRLLKDEAFIKTTNEMKIHENSNKLAVIIDPRFDDLMEAVIRNFIYFMNPKGWNFLIVSYSGYEEKIKNTFPNAFFLPIQNELIMINDKGIPNISIYTYNSIMMNIEFWKLLPQKIAIFQKDCIMFKMFEDYFEEQYDFAGALFDYTIVNLPDKNNIEKFVLSNNKSVFHKGINGGFSLRNRDTMIECLEKITFDKITEFREIMFEKLNIKFSNEVNGIEQIIDPKVIVHNEDVFFTCACEMLTKTLPDCFHRSLLAIESIYNENSCIYHGWNKNYHSTYHAINILMKSPLFSKYINLFGNVSGTYEYDKRTENIYIKKKSSV
jgi:hypothetical protein